MEFQDKGLPLSDEGMDQICELLGVNEPEVWAVLTVETRGFGFLKDRRPQILFNDTFSAEIPIVNLTPSTQTSAVEAVVAM